MSAFALVVRVRSLSVSSCVSTFSTCEFTLLGCVRPFRLCECPVAFFPILTKRRCTHAWKERTNRTLKRGRRADVFNGLFLLVKLENAYWWGYLHFYLSELFKCAFVASVLVPLRVRVSVEPFPGTAVSVGLMGFFSLCFLHVFNFLRSSKSLSLQRLQVFYVFKSSMFASLQRLQINRLLKSTLHSNYQRVKVVKLTESSISSSQNFHRVIKVECRQFDLK